MERRFELGPLSMDLHTRLSALRKIWICCAAVCGVAMIASLAIQSFSLDQPLNELEENRSEDDSKC
jgi:hypothetical protein